jgi:hypothetical protein
LLRFAAAALVEEDQLLLRTEWGEGGPEDIMAEVEAAVHGEQGKRVGHGLAREHGELKAASRDGAHFERRRFSLLLPESEEALASRAGVHRTKLAALNDAGFACC